jgi:lipoprotein-releasing system permease protein
VPNIGFALTVAIRFLREGRFQSLLIIVGVAVGVGVVTYISALIDGLQGNTIRRTLGTQAHIVVKPLDERATPSLRAPDANIARDVQPRAQRTRSVDNWRAMMAEMQSTPNVVAVTPIAAGAGLALRGEASRSIALVGIELEGYDRIVAIREKVVEGIARVAPGEAMIGLQLAQDLGVSVGERIVIRTAGDVSENYKIIGIFDLGSRELNRRQVYVSLKSAQSLLNIPGGVTNIYASVSDLFGAGETARRLKARTGYEIESWMESNAQLLSALNAQSISTGIIRGFTAIVVMLGIASVLVVSVVQKRKEIGILRAMGATRWQMTQVFLMQGAIVGLIGSVLGVLIAQLMILLFMAFARGGDGQPLFVIVLPMQLAITVAFIATICGVLAAAAPARRAAQLDPAQAIRL